MSADTEVTLSGYVRKPQMAKHLGISTRSLNNLMRKRVVPFYKVSGGVVLFRLSEVSSALSRWRVDAVGGSAK